MIQFLIGIIVGGVIGVAMISLLELAVMTMNKVLVWFFGVLAAAFAAAFAVHFMLFQTRGYSCVHGIQMIFYGLNTWGFGIMAAICGGRK